MMKKKTGLSMLAAAASFAALATFAQACGPECVDVFDCNSRSSGPNDPWTCYNGSCVQGSPIPLDAGQ